jgi:hypothetical protein
MKLRYFTLVLAMLASACFGDSTGGNAIADVSGQWSVDATGFRGGSGAYVFTCDIRNMRMILTQSGGGFTGRTEGGTQSCAYVGQTTGPSGDLPPFIVTDGVVGESGITFTLTIEPSDEVEFSGTVESNGRSMSGVGRWDKRSISGDRTVLDGAKFTATRN